MRLTLPALLCSLALLFCLPAQADHVESHRASNQQLSQLQGSLRALRQALNRIGKEKQRLSYTQPIADKTEKLEQEALRLVEQQQHNQAHKQLKLAMDVVKTGIATLRNQETLIRSLDFTSPQDEFRYEQQRFEHFCQLVDLLITSKGNPKAIALRQQAQVISNAAAQQARDQQFSEAIKAQEQSNRLMLQAIRHSGIDLPTG